MLTSPNVVHFVDGMSNINADPERRQLHDSTLEYIDANKNLQNSVIQTYRRVTGPCLLWIEVKYLPLTRSAAVWKLLIICLAFVENIDIV